MNEMTINFLKGHFNSAACISTGNREIYFNMRILSRMAIGEDMTFGETFALCMSHELIHQIIYDTEGDEASDQFDNICYRKYRRMKNWIGGVGGA